MINPKLIRIATTAAVVSLLLASCSLFNGPAPRSDVVKFDYRSTSKGKLKVVQVYEFSGKTIIQLRDIQSLQISVFDGKNQRLPYQTLGDNVVLDGIQPHLTIVTQIGSATIEYVKHAGMVLQKNSSNFSQNPNVYADVTEQELKLRIARIRDEIAELKLKLVQEKSNLQAARTSSKVIISFKDNMTSFEPTVDQQQAILELIQQSSDISIRGFTDSNIATKSASIFAQRRAMAAQQYLVKMGVDPRSIAVGFESHGGFISDNRLPAGKARNRRVEIESH